MINISQLVALALLVSVPSIAFAKKKGKDALKIHKIEPVINTDSIAKGLALNVRDYQTAIVYSYNLLAKNPTDSALQYEIAKLYFLNKQYQLSINSCMSILANDSLNAQALELSAVSYKSLENYEASVQVYYEVTRRLKTPTYLYKAAVIQFETKQFDACLKTLNFIANDSTTSSKTVLMTRQNLNGRVLKEEINLLAASYNIVGFIALENKNFDMAKQYFSKALSIEPTFVLAENNLKEVLKQQKSAASKEPTK